MLEDNPADESTTTESPAGDAAEAAPAEQSGDTPPARKAAKRATKKSAAKRSPRKATPDAASDSTPDAAPDAAATSTAATDPGDAPAPEAGESAGADTADERPAPRKRAAKKTAQSPAKKATAGRSGTAKTAKATTRKTSGKKGTASAATTDTEAAAEPATEPADAAGEPATEPAATEAAATEAATEPATELPATAPLFQPPDPNAAPKRRARTTKKAAKAAESAEPTESTEGTEPADAADRGEEQAARTQPDGRSTRRAKAQGTDQQADQQADEQTDEQTDRDADEDGGAGRRRRRRGGRRRRRGGDNGGGDSADASSGEETDATSEGDGGDSGDQADSGDQGSTSRRRRRRRRTGEDGDGNGEDPQNTVTKVRSKRAAEDQITGLSGSTRLEAKKQRRREGREAGRRRAPIVSEAEFLARRESVDRVMVVRQRDDLTQIGVLEDKVLVEHYVARESQTSLIGNVYLGRVQNVLPSMEAAFIDIGKGRNAVLYAGEVNWSALGHPDGQPRKIESVLSSGQSVLVQVTKDPVGHKGARLTSQISLAGRFLVYVPDGTNSGISRELPDTERNRLKALLKEIVPDSAGVIVRTAAEGASEDELTRDVERLKARWENIEAKSRGSAPQLLYGEPDLTLKVVRDLFTEDFSKLVIQGDDAWETVQSYVAHVAPDLEDRLQRYEPGRDGQGGKADVFAEYRIEEQIKKGLDRKVWLPSGGSLIIDRTEAMTVVDVNTGKFTGSGGNLEETVTRNNLEAAEEIVRQLRLRDIGGIIVVDFIDMVLESNRDLVLRRLVECLGRDRTRHQVAEVTSLGLVQMTRKRIGTGLLEAFGVDCEHCHGRGVVLQDAPVEPSRSTDGDRRSTRRRGRRDDNGSGNGSGSGSGSGSGRSAGDGGRSDASAAPSPKVVAAMARPENAGKPPVDGLDGPAAGQGETADADQAPDPAPETQPQKEPQKEPQTGPQTEPATVPDPTPDTARDTAPGRAPDTAPDTAPKVVTRTRRRAASRPAGPPSSDPVAQPTPEPVAPELDEVSPLPGVGAPPPSGLVEPGTADVEPGLVAEEQRPQVEHVPVKKRGARKR